MPIHVSLPVGSVKWMARAPCEGFGEGADSDSVFGSPSSGGAGGLAVVALVAVATTSGAFE